MFCWFYIRTISRTNCKYFDIFIVSTNSVRDCKFVVQVGFAVCQQNSNLLHVRTFVSVSQQEHIIVSKDLTYQQSLAW